MRQVAAAIVLLSASALILRAQTARDRVVPTPTGAGPTITIRGRVLAEDSGNPLTNARVTTTSSVGAPSVVLTDGDGRFALPSASSSPDVSVMKAGYASAKVSHVTSDANVDIRLARGAAIEGRVLDTFGAPAIGVRVTAEARGGSPPTPTILGTTDTDDRGEYRVGSLAVGDVAVSVTFAPAFSVNQNQFDRQQVYYPGVPTLAAATWIPTHAGEDHRGVDFVVPPDQSSTFTVGLFGPARAPDESVAGVIRGRVVSTDGRVLARTQVLLLPPNGPPRLVTADELGRYEFPHVPAGASSVQTKKLGYSMLEPGTPGPFGPATSVELIEGETRERVDIALAPWRAISGRLFDEYGDPVEGASVQVLQVRFEAGQRRLVSAAVASRLTDDLGQYRVFGVPPGDYVLSATIGPVASADVPGYARAYFPGTPNANEAQFTTMGRSADVAGLDFSLTRIATAHVRGHAFNAAGQPSTSGFFLLVPSQRSGSVTGVSVGARTFPEGAFDFPNVPPGEYIIQAYRGRQNSSNEGEFGALAIVVNGTDVTDLILRTAPGSAVTGRVRFDGGDPPAGAIDLSPLPVDADFSPWGASQVAHAHINADWTFDMAGISGRRRLEVVDAPKGWALKAVIVDGRDVTDEPLSFGRPDQSLRDVNIVLTNQITRLRGAVADDQARPVPNEMLVVWVTESARWYPGSRFLRKTVAGRDGTFTVECLPQGNYFVAAVNQLPTDGEEGWQAPDFLESLVSRASTVALSDGQTATLSLQLSR